MCWWIFVYDTELCLFGVCRVQATLTAVIDNHHVSTMVSTTELNMTSGMSLHRLTAKAVIRDWEDGALAEHRLEHEVVLSSGRRERGNGMVGDWESKDTIHETDYFYLIKYNKR